MVPISFANATALGSGRLKTDFVISENIKGDGTVNLLISTKRKQHYPIKDQLSVFGLLIPTLVSLIFGLYGASYDI